MAIDNDDRISGPGKAEASFGSLCERRYSRRQFVKSGVALGVAASALGIASCANNKPPVKNAEIAKPDAPSFNFVEVEHGIGKDHVVAPDHNASVLIRWGDPIFPGAPEFDLHKQSVQSQKQQFGFNNDYIGYLDLPPESGQQARALLCVNHEYPGVGMMFPKYPSGPKARPNAKQVAIAQAAIGNSIIEVAQQDGDWRLVQDSPYNRRISAYDTPIELSGPVAGHDRVKTSTDPSGKNVIGTLNNCAGGMTPWGSYLTCEENFNFHFSGKPNPTHRETPNHARHNMPLDLFHWGHHDPRFDLSKEPNEPNRFGWVVEIDPMNPQSTPKKRTALGRFKHEGAESVVAPDGRLVVYMGDDQRFEYLYKFISRDQVNLENPKANNDLLDDGTLYVAKFDDEGELEWMPLSYENELLRTKFASQADILLEARRAADVLQATPMDRPEDVVPNASSGKVYVMLSNNGKRKKVNGPNPRANNRFGQIVEISEPEGDFAALKSRWNMLVKCGNPAKPEHGAQWNPATSKNGWFASPDNGVIDPQGRLWVTSDQGPAVPLSGTNDGLWALETEGELRGTGRMFFRTPNGAEMTGPAFSDDGKNLFLAVQHPGDQVVYGTARLDTATTRWPDFKAGLPPRPSIVVVRRNDGGTIG